MVGMETEYEHWTRMSTKTERIEHRSWASGKLPENVSMHFSLVVWLFVFCRCCCERAHIMRGKVDRLHYVQHTILYTTIANYVIVFRYIYLHTKHGGYFSNDMQSTRESSSKKEKWPFISHAMWQQKVGNSWMCLIWMRRLLLITYVYVYVFCVFAGIWRIRICIMIWYTATDGYTVL